MRYSLIINLMALDAEISDVTFGHLPVTSTVIKPDRLQGLTGKSGLNIYKPRGGADTPHQCIQHSHLPVGSTHQPQCHQSRPHHSSACSSCI